MGGVEDRENAASWFSHGDSLIAELRHGRHRMNRTPELPGYEDLREIGRGGQGVVYSARQRSTQRRVAVKFLDEHASEAGRNRFKLEVKLAASLGHPNIVRVFDSDANDDGRLFVVMEYIEGAPLDQYVQRRLAEAGSGQATAGSDSRATDVDREILLLFVSICRAVHYAHQRGVIHRDLKPGNILIDVEGQPHILDFGLARAVEATGPRAFTRSDAFVGTLAFASPEQVNRGASDVDVRTDIYALGVMLYRILTGRHPYDVDGPMAQVIRAICEQTPTPPSRIAFRFAVDDEPAWPGRTGQDLDTIVLTALAKEKERRYQTVENLALDIERYLADEPIDALRDSTAYLLRKLLARHRGAAALAAVFVLALSGFAVALTILYQRAQMEGDKARQINYFLQDTLASVRPAKPGDPVTMNTVLNDALHWLATLEGQPEIEASVRQTIGNSYRALREYAAAETQLQAALTIRQQLFGDLNLQTAESMAGLAWLRLDQGRIDEAEMLWRDVLAIRRRLLGMESLDVAMAHAGMAQALLAADKHEKAEHHVRHCLRIRRRRLRDHHPEIAVAWNLLGEIKQAGGDLNEASDCYERALILRRELHDVPHPDTAASALALGLVLRELGRDEEARTFLGESHEIFSAIGVLDDPRARRARDEMAKLSQPQRTRSTPRSNHSQPGK